MKELLKDPEANKEILSAHKVDTSNYEKEAKQSEGQAKETASLDDASKTMENNCFLLSLPLRHEQTVVVEHKEPVMVGESSEESGAGTA